jgi:hypothetical protein
MHVEAVRSETAFEFLNVGEVARRERCSERTIHELARLGRIPHRRRPYMRELVFYPEELDAWRNGAELEVEEQKVGGKVVGRTVRPKGWAS